MQTFNIDIAQAPAPLVLYAKQGDGLSRFFQINFLESGQPWTPPTGATFAVRYGVPGLPSGWYDTIQEPDGSSHSAFGLLGNALTVEIAYEAVSASGRNSLCVLVLDSNGYQLGAWNLALQVEITPGENAPESTQYYSLLSAQVAKVLASVTDAENAATLAESWAVGGTGTREGEDTNNAEYWAGRAAASAGQSLGFRTFSAAVSPDPVSGDVDPTSPMLMANLTATSAAARLDHVVIPGKTTQEGSGDPSPANVRPLSGVGRKMVKLPITSGENWVKTTSPSGNIYFECAVGSAPVPQSSTSAEAANAQFCNVAKIGNTDFNPSIMLIYARARNGQNVIRIGGAGLSKVEDLKAYLDTANAVIYYTPADESQATGWYTWEAVDGDTYSAVGLPLNGQLYDGDSVANDVPSGFDKMLVFDGSSDEKWSLNDSGKMSKRFGYNNGAPGAVGGAANCASNRFVSVASPAEVYQSFPYVSTYAGGWVDANVPGIETLEDWKAYLSENPLTLFYKSTEYSRKNDIRAEIETHSNGFVTVDGTDTPFTQGTDGYSIALPGAADGPVTNCNAFTGLTVSGGVCTIPASAFPSSVTSLETANQWAAQNPVQLLYPLSAPAVYAHPAQPLANPAGTWTLSAENTPQGYMRALSDANHADMADTATTATTADQLAGQPPAWYMPTGAVIPYAGSSAPDGWLLCDGRTVSRTTYAALFAVIGATYGAGNGSTTFALPDLRGRVAAGANASNALASKAGADSKQITRANLPAEKLNLEDNGTWIVDSVQTGSESGRTLQMGTRSGAARLETNTLGSGTAFDVRQATLYLNYIIKY